ncbi:outer membrane transport energization protein TonB [Pseudoxanthomonas sp. GM95]|uniref:energy transducer TonB n=1 Tax=Pseudoxanthomonas sp. GM95 TaxID=1881043 RepID=UPI0008D372F4|nr:energy transducer TonB [Pseudoxanthomonas sp. GM95]SEM25212.1 outer membrane transport energization protein TonB [Pseudoxanthomonas sp. GM95]
MSKHSLTALRPVAALALLGLLAACSPKQAETTTDGAATGTPTDPATAAQAVAADTPPKPAVAASVQAMSADDLRAAANKALGQNRIYAPGGDNAMEYYLALRDKQPDDPATTSALTDLMPYTVIAAEQSIGRKDFEEAKRLQALITKADPKAPALPRLSAAIAGGEKLLAQQTTDEASKAKAAADAKTKEVQRVAEQAAQQKQAADALAAQQREAARAEAARPAAAAAPPRQAPAERPAPVAETPAPAPAAPAASSSGERRLLSAPPPRYPMDALRASTSGQVVVEITIGGDGDVTNARVVEASPPRVFDRAALTAVKRWKFEPTGSVSTTRRTIAFNPG